MSKNLLKNLDEEIIDALNGNINVDKDQMLVANYVKTMEAVAASEKQSQLNAKNQKEQLSYQKEKDEANRQLEREKLAQELTLKTRELDLKELELDIKRAQLAIEDKKIDAEVKVEEIKAANDAKNRKWTAILGFAKLATFIGMGTASMTMEYVDNGMTPKLFTKSMDNSIK